MHLKAAEDHSIGIGPTGCMHVANSSYMCTPYAIPWAHTPIASGGSFTSGLREYDPETRTYDYWIPETQRLVVEYLKLRGIFGRMRPEHIAKIQASANQKWEMIGADVPAELREAEDPDFYVSRGLSEAGAKATDQAKARQIQAPLKRPAGSGRPVRLVGRRAAAPRPAR